jgi:hypothetical protein
MNDKDKDNFYRMLRLGIVNTKGVFWYDAPLPRRWHRCKPWTNIITIRKSHCACGAWSYYDGHHKKVWVGKNCRRNG